MYRLEGIYGGPYNGSCVIREYLWLTYLSAYLPVKKRVGDGGWDRVVEVPV